MFEEFTSILSIADAFGSSAFAPTWESSSVQAEAIPRELAQTRSRIARRRQIHSRAERRSVRARPPTSTICA